MSVISDVGTVVAVVTGFLFFWSKALPSERDEFKSIVHTFRRSVIKVATLIGCFVFILSGEYEIYKFGTNEAAVTHREVLWVLVNIVCVVVYLITALLLVSYWNKQKVIQNT